VHHPGRPKTPAPPENLRVLLANLRHSSVTQTGLTTTEDGDWALLVRIRPGEAFPYAELSKQAPGIPIICEDISEPPVARPAYPCEGE
jgi:hypothetical protein